MATVKQAGAIAFRRKGGELRVLLEALERLTFDDARQLLRKASPMMERYRCK